MHDLTEKEEADLVLQHMGWVSAWAYIVACAEILFDTRDIDYDLSVDPEYGHDARSSFVIRPHIKSDDWPFEKIRDREDMLHRFIELANKEIHMMTRVSVFYDADPEPPKQEQK